MLAPGQTLSLSIEKPAAGGRMIARAGGQVVLVAGAIPGERVAARITAIRKGVAYADTIDVEEPSADRREPGADPLCGGCLYAHIAYPRQLAIKSLIVADAFARIARMSLPRAVAVASSPVDGYRMRARLHRRGTRFGFFREGTHDLCDPRASGQLRSDTCDVIDRLPAAMTAGLLEAVREIEIEENTDASQRVLHLDIAINAGGELPDAMTALDGVTGVSASDPSGRARIRTDSTGRARRNSVRRSSPPRCRTYGRLRGPDCGRKCTHPCGCGGRH